MNTNIEGHLYDITRRRVYSNIVDQLLYSLSKSAYIKISDKVWMDVEIPVADTVWGQGYIHVRDKVFDYEY